MGELTLRGASSFLGAHGKSGRGATREVSATPSGEEVGRRRWCRRGRGFLEGGPIARPPSRTHPGPSDLIHGLDSPKKNSL